MTRRTAALAITGLLLGAGALQADTALIYATPKNLKEHGFELISKARKNKTVEFVITRNIKGIDGPGRAGYLTKLDEKTLGTRIKLREEGDTLEFRFTLPEDEVSTSRFMLWGQGARGEGVTFEFKLKDFRPYSFRQDHRICRIDPDNPVILSKTARTATERPGRLR